MIGLKYFLLVWKSWLKLLQWKKQTLCCFSCSVFRIIFSWTCWSSENEKWLLEKMIDSSNQCNTHLCMFVQNSVTISFQEDLCRMSCLSTKGSKFLCIYTTTFPLEDLTLIFQLQTNYHMTTILWLYELLCAICCKKTKCRAATNI